jgi:hypothetical protein
MTTTVLIELGPQTVVEDTFGTFPTDPPGHMYLVEGVDYAPPTPALGLVWNSVRGVGICEFNEPPVEEPPFDMQAELLSLREFVAGKLTEIAENITPSV